MVLAETVDPCNIQVNENMPAAAFLKTLPIYVKAPGPEMIVNGQSIQTTVDGQLIEVKVKAKTVDYNLPFNLPKDSAFGAKLIPSLYSNEESRRAHLEVSIGGNSAITEQGKAYTYLIIKGKAGKNETIVFYNPEKTKAYKMDIIYSENDITDVSLGNQTCRSITVNRSPVKMLEITVGGITVESVSARE